MHRRLLLATGLIGAAFAAGPALAAEEKKKGGGTQFLQMRALTATIMRSDRRRGALTVEVGLNVPNDALRARADLSSPRLRAAFIEFLAGYASRLPPATAPDPDYLEKQLQQITDRTLGQPGAQVLLGTMLIN
jgi:hypothetical protein